MNEILARCLRKRVEINEKYCFEPYCPHKPAPGSGCKADYEGTRKQEAERKKRKTNIRETLEEERHMSRQRGMRRSEVQEIK